MKNIFFILLPLMFAILLIGESSGAGVSFEQVKLSGSGCKKVTTDTVLAFDKKTLSILFNDMNVEVPQYSGDNENDEYGDYNRTSTSRFNEYVAHKVCNMMIMAKIPQGKKVESIELSVDFRGNSMMDYGTQALFHSQLVSIDGPNRISRRAKDTIARKVYRMGDADEDFILSQKKVIQLDNHCADSRDKTVKFVLKNTLKAQIHPRFRGQDVMALLSLDSADLTSKLKIKLNITSCGTSGRGRVERPVSRRDNYNQCQTGMFYSARYGRCMSKREVVRSRRGSRRHRSSAKVTLLRSTY